jgi:hypothetical protein
LEIHVVDNLFIVPDDLVVLEGRVGRHEPASRALKDVVVLRERAGRAREL